MGEWAVALSLVLAIVIVMILVLKASSRHNEKKRIFEEHHYPIDMTKYSKIIYVMGLGETEIRKMIDEHIALIDEPDMKEPFSVEGIEDTGWSKVVCPCDISFYGYHNLVQWFDGRPEDNTHARDFIGIMNHLSDDEKSYYVVSDGDNQWRDTVIGSFNNGKSFTIDLPASYEEEGNMVLSRPSTEVMSLKEIKKRKGINT